MCGIVGVWGGIDVSLVENMMESAAFNIFFPAFTKY